MNINEMNFKTKILLAAIIVVATILFGGLAYAYFTASPVTGNSNNAIILQTADHGGGIMVHYENDKNYIDLGIVDLKASEIGVSTADYLKFNVEYTGGISENIIIYWKDVVSNFCQYASGQTCTDLNTDTYVGNEINYTLYECESTDYDAITSATDTDITSCDVVGVEDSAAPVTGNDDNINNTDITMLNETKYYVLTMKIDNLNKEQNYDQGKSFTGKIWVDIEGAELSGVAYNSQGDPVNQGYVEMRSTPQVVRTDENGNYRFKNVLYGIHTLTIKDSGNNTLGTNSVVLQKGSESKTANILTIANKRITTGIQATNDTKITFLPVIGGGVSATFGTDTINFANANMLGYKILTDTNVQKYTTPATMGKLAVTQEYYNTIVEEYGKWYATEQYYAIENGLFKETDDDGATYYYRGHVENNYVRFAGFWWRIMRINGDGSIRLALNKPLDGIKKNDAVDVECLENNCAGPVTIYDSRIDCYRFPEESALYPVEDNWEDVEDYFSYEGSGLESVVNSFYTTYLYNIENSLDYRNYLADSRFCNDLSFDITHQKESYENHLYGGWSQYFEKEYNAYIYEDNFGQEIPYTLSHSNVSATYLCPNSYTYKQGAIGNMKGLLYPIATITSDDLIFAGTNYTNVTLPNTDFYFARQTVINSSIDEWTMTPGGIFYDEGYALPYMIELQYHDNYGDHETFTLTYEYFDSFGGISVRPVINLKADTLVTGSGTAISPYEPYMN